MKLYLIRHGQSETNLKGLFTGQADVALTPSGEADARRAGEMLRCLRFDKVYASDLTRAMRTAELALPGVEYETSPLLREYDLGELVGQRISACRTIYAPDFEENWKKHDYTPYGGENADMVKARAKAFLDQLRQSEHQTVAVFAHAGFIRAIFDVLLGIPLKDGGTEVANGSISVFTVRKTSAALLLWNYTGRLPDEAEPALNKPI